MIKGTSDLLILEPSGIYKSLFIELKIAYNKPKPNQINFMKINHAKGYFVCWSNNIELVKKCISNYMKGNHIERDKNFKLL